MAFVKGLGLRPDTESWISETPSRPTDYNWKSTVSKISAQKWPTQQASFPNKQQANNIS